MRGDDHNAGRDPLFPGEAQRQVDYRAATAGGAAGLRSSIALR